EKRVFLVILFTSFSGSLVSRIPGAVQKSQNAIYILALPVGKSTCHNKYLFSLIPSGTLISLSEIYCNSGI
ncbi:hypothetical protein, partial [Escherichia coli]|uniref:hypothetical protein n=1 Tax=Escherichia coli TaxID=562 RepID=UPI001BC837B2